MAGTYTFAYEFTAENSADAAEATRTRTWIFPVAFGLVSGASFATSDSGLDPIQTVTVAFVVACFVGLIALVLGRLLRPRHFIEALAAGRIGRSLMGVRYELTLTNDGLAWKSALANGDAPWATVTDVRTNLRSMAFVRDRVCFGYIPTSAFESPAQRADVLRFAQKRIAMSHPAGAPAIRR